jgi:hypothetical protein
MQLMVIQGQAAGETRCNKGGECRGTRGTEKEKAGGTRAEAKERGLEQHDGAGSGAQSILYGVVVE